MPPARPEMVKMMPRVPGKRPKRKMKNNCMSATTAPSPIVKSRSGTSNFTNKATGSRSRFSCSTASDRGPLFLTLSSRTAFVASSVALLAVVRFGSCSSQSGRPKTKVNRAAENTPQRSGSVLAAETWSMPAINSGMAPPKRLPRAPTPSKRKLFSANTPTRCLSVVLSVSRGKFVTQ